MSIVTNLLNFCWKCKVEAGSITLNTHARTSTSPESRIDCKHRQKSTASERAMLLWGKAMQGLTHLKETLSPPHDGYANTCLSLAQSFGQLLQFSTATFILQFAITSHQIVALLELKTWRVGSGWYLDEKIPR